MCEARHHSRCGTVNFALAFIQITLCGRRARRNGEKADFQSYHVAKAIVEPPADAACQDELPIPTLPSCDPANQGGCRNQRVKLKMAVALGLQADFTVPPVDTPEPVDRKLGRRTYNDDIAALKLLYQDAG